MAQLKDTVVAGSLRVTDTIYGDTIYGDTIRLTAISAPTSSNGTTYSKGTNGYVLVSNGTTVYWSNNISITGNAATATKAGVSTIWMYPENNNEINFGGSNTGTIIYFGYRTKDSRAIPTKFIFGSSTGTADLQAKIVYLGSGTSSYISSTQYTGNAATATEFSSNATVKLTGDVTGETSAKKGWEVATTLASITRTNNTSTASPSHGGNFTVIDSITTDTKGRVTAVNTKTVTLPNDNNTWNALSTSQAGYVSQAPNSTLKFLRGDATWAQVSEASLVWGGQNFNGSYGCIDAAMVDTLGANRLMFLKPAGITIKYTRDGGSTWIDYGATDTQKCGLFAAGQNFYIGKADSTNKATANGTNYQLEVIIDTGTASVYTTLNKFVIYISTGGSNNCTVTIQKALQSTPSTYENVVTDVPISGWSGYNVINVADFITYGNTASSQYGRIRFLFKANGGNTSYVGLAISQIMGFGGVGWTTPSTMAKTGHLYAYDNSLNASFPAMVTATNFNGNLTGNITGNAATATKLKTARSINGTDFDGTANITTDIWGTARTLTIGATGKSVNGSAAVSWSKAEILGSSDTAHFYRGDNTWANVITGPFAVDTSADAAKAFSVRRTGAGEAAAHYIDDSHYYIVYTNDEAASQVVLRITNTDTEGGNGSNASTFDYVFTSAGELSASLFNGAIKDTGDGRKLYFSYSSPGMTSTSWLGSWDGNTLKAISPATAIKSGVGTTAIGGGEQPIYWTGSAFSATSYALKATVNNGTTTRLAYYSGAKAISSGTIVTDGAYLASLSYLTINDTHQTDYRLKVNGDANITNQAKINNITITEDTITSGSALYLDTAASTSLVIKKAGVNKFRYDDAGSAIHPEVTGTIALGTTSLAWANIYGNGLHANVGNRNNAGGLSLWGTTITDYGIAMRTGAAHGWICAATTTNLAVAAAATGIDWNINFYLAGSVNRGWKFMLGSAVAASISGRGYISANRLNLNRIGGSKNGRIYWYDTDVASSPYYTWVDYVSDASNGSAPTGGKPSTLEAVTAWAKRSLVENADGYGWVWESAANSLASANTTQPTARMALSSHSGRLFVNSSAGPSKSVIQAYSNNAVSSGGYQWGLNHYDDKLAAGANTCILTGFSNTSNNQAVFGFHYAGSNSNDNYLELGLYSNNNLVKLYKNNRMAIKASTYPDVTRTYTLGTSSLYWNGAYIYAGGTIHEANIYWGGSGGDMTTIYNTADNNRGITAFRYPSYNFGNKTFGLSAESVTIEYTTNSGSSWAAVTDAWYSDDRKRNLFNYNDTQIPVGNLPKYDYGSSATTQAATVGMGVRVTADFEHENRIFNMSTIETYWRIYCCTCTCTIEMFDDYNDTWTTLWTDSYNNVDTRRYYHFGMDKACDGARVNRAGRFHKLRWTIIVTAVGTSNIRFVPALGAISVYGVGVPTFSTGTVTPTGGTATIFKHGSRFAWAMARWNTPIYVENYNKSGLGTARIPTTDLYIGDDMRYSAANTEKWSTLILGNEQNISGENAHSQGRICIFSAATKAHFIQGASTTTNYSHYLPNANGWIATGGNGSSTGAGAANTPVFLSTAGVLTACSGTLNLNSITSSYSQGFTGRTTSSTWGNTTGTHVTGWTYTGGCEIAFLANNPSSGKLSVKIDGRYYFAEGNACAMGALYANEYWGLATPDGDDSRWIRTTSNGIIPYQSGAEGSGHCSLGTSSWCFSQAYIDTINSVTINNSGDLNFAAIGATGTSGKITWNGSTIDGADIYYYVPSSDQKNLVINTRDNTNCNVIFAYNGTMKIGISPSSSVPCIYPVTNNNGALGSASLEWGQTYTRAIYARHFDSSMNVTSDRNMYYGYNRGQGHYFYSNDGTTQTHLATINTNGIYCHSGWFISQGQTGWYNETYGGGWYMTDTTWIRAYNNKPIYLNGYHAGIMRSYQPFSWIDASHGRSQDATVGCGLRLESAASNGAASCLWSMKTDTGEWGCGGLSGNDNLYFTWGSDANWNAGTNTIGGQVYMTSDGTLRNAAWNDYAECRDSDCNEPGAVVIDNANGKTYKSTARLQPCAHVISDTYGICIGESDNAKTPLAVSGRVLVMPYQDRNNYKVGDCVCTAPNGTVDIMSREEIITYPDRIVGIVSEIPEYEEWDRTLTTTAGGVKTSVPVNGRIWIYVR